MCVCGVARDTKKSPHVRTATNESEEELGTRGIFFSFPLNFFCFGKVCRGVLCLSLFLSLYYKGAAAVGRV